MKNLFVNSVPPRVCTIVILSEVDAHLYDSARKLLDYRLSPALGYLLGDAGRRHLAIP